jgi:hypothetical protein
MIVNEFAAQKMKIDYFPGDSGIDFPVEGVGHAFHFHFNRGFGMTEAHASGLLNHDIVHFPGVGFSEKYIQSLFGSGSNSAGTHADNNLNTFTTRIPVFHSLLFPEFPEGFQA